jgi:hypothetical protein
MLNFLQERRKKQTVMGHRLEEPRLTLMVVPWALLYAGLPLLALGTLIDLLIQALTGHCTGFWC